MADMTNDLFAQYSFGKAALFKFGEVDPNFRLFDAVWLGNGLQRDVMKVTAAVFRCSTLTVNRDKLTVMVPNTKRTVYLTPEEMSKFSLPSSAQN